MNFSLQFAMQLPQNSLKKVKEGVFTVILHCLARILYFLFTDLFSNPQLGTSKPNLNQYVTEVHSCDTETFHSVLL